MKQVVRSTLIRININASATTSFLSNNNPLAFRSTTQHAVIDFNDSIYKNESITVNPNNYRYNMPSTTHLLSNNTITKMNEQEVRVPKYRFDNYTNCSKPDVHLIMILNSDKNTTNDNASFWPTRLPRLEAVASRLNSSEIIINNNTNESTSHSDDQKPTSNKYVGES